MSERNMQDLLEEYQAQESMYHMEGESGVADLEKLLKVLGYKGHNFKYGSVIESFLADNSGAIEAIVNWLGEQNVTEWEERLEEELPPEEDDTDPREACPGCGCMPGDGYTAGCDYCEEAEGLFRVDDVK
jgi:hypothetical protein